LKYLYFALALVVASCSSDGSQQLQRPTTATPTVGFSIVNSYPKNKQLFTQGLFFHDGNLYESTGGPKGYGELESKIGLVHLDSGTFTPLAGRPSSRYFGEGAIAWNSQFIQLTYKSKKVFYYDQLSGKLMDEKPLPSQEGWGMASKGDSLLFSDGTNTLYWVEPQDFTVTSQITVKEGRYAVDKLNELEWVGDTLFANIWQENRIVLIDPKGKVLGQLNLEALMLEEKESNPSARELNGIAYRPESNTLFVTGKYWSRYVEIRLKPEAV